jgi:hypothetical protein
MKLLIAIEVFNWYYDYHIAWQEIRLPFDNIQL